MGMLQGLLVLGQGPVLVFLCILLRVGGLVLTAPLLGRPVPIRVRMLLTVALSLLIVPLQLPWTGEFPRHGVELLLMLTPELMLGLAYGLALLLLSAGVCLAGQLMSRLSGVQLAGGEGDESGGGAAVMSRLLDLVTIATFLVLGGHRQVLGAVLDSFRWMPPGQGKIRGDIVPALLDVAGQSFDLGLRVATPVVVAVLVAILVVGMISRTLPQVNAVAVGFNLNMLVMLAAALVSLGALVLVFPQYVDAALEHISQAAAGP